MGKIYLLKQIGEYWPKSAKDRDTDLYMYEIKIEEKEEGRKDIDIKEIEKNKELEKEIALCYSQIGQEK